MEKRTDKHHVFWPRRTYREDHILWQLRSRTGLIVPMYRERHNELHAKLAPPITPTPEVAADILDYLDEEQPVDEVLAVRHFMLDEFFNRTNSPRHRDLCQRIARHITKQLTYIGSGIQNESIEQQVLDWGQPVASPERLDG